MKKSILHIMVVLLFGMTTMAFRCDDDYPGENEYVMSEDNVPQEYYHTTISASYFQQCIVGYGWKLDESWKINADGVASLYITNGESDFIPKDLYFDKDSITLFLFKQNINERQSDAYTYDVSKNLIVSKVVDYMQLAYAGSTNIKLIERIGNTYYANYYERMLPYELNALWNGSKPEEK